jgi:hypothetical protein
VLKQGGSIETPAEAYKRETLEKYGDTGHALATAAESAMSTLTGGQSTGWLAHPEESFGAKAGVGAFEPTATDAETISRMREANPGSAILGTVGSFFVPMGAGAAAIKAGEAAEKLIVKAFTKEGASVSVAKDIATRLMAKGGAGAVETSLFGLGQLVDENALGKADINAENLMAVLGPSAILGAGLGAGLGAVSMGAEKLVKFGRGQIEKAAADFADKNAAAGELFGLTPAQSAKMKDRKGYLYNEMASFLEKDVGLSARQSPAERLKRVHAIERESGEKIGQVIKDVDAELAATPSKIPMGGEFHNVIAQDLYKMQESLGKAYGAEAQKASLESLIVDAQRLRLANEPLSAVELQRQKKVIDDLVKWSQRQSDAPIKEQALRDIRRTYSKQLDVMADLATENLAAKGVKGSDLGKELRDANKRYSFTQELLEPLEKKASKDQPFRGGMWNVASNIVMGGDLRAKAAVLLNLEKANVKAAKVLDSVTSNFSKGIKMVERPARTVLQESILSKDLENNKKAKSKQEAVANMAKNLNAYAQNPDAFMQRLNEKTVTLYNHAPNTSGFLDTNMVSAMQFLNSKMPKGNLNNGVYSAFKQPRFSDMQISKFERYFEAIEKPLDTLKKLQNNMLTREHIEVIKSVYPNLYTTLQHNVMTKLSKNPGAFSYNKRVQLGLLLNVATDASMNPQNIMGLQSNFSVQSSYNESGAEQGAVKPTQGGLEKLSKSDSMRTETQQEEEQ